MEWAEWLARGKRNIRLESINMYQTESHGEIYLCLLKWMAWNGRWTECKNQFSKIRWAHECAEGLNKKPTYSEWTGFTPLWINKIAKKNKRKMTFRRAKQRPLICILSFFSHRLLFDVIGCVHCNIVTVSIFFIICCFFFCPIRLKCYKY